MLIEVLDDFDLEKIALSGQCFRVARLHDGKYRFITGDNVIYIQKAGKAEFSVSCNNDQWGKIWYSYFDLDRCYCDIFEKECNKHQFIHETMEFGRGIRILRQNSWEMLITFIISQRKSIPAISKAVEMIAARFGHRIETEFEIVSSFPTPQEMANVTEKELMECGLGYRTRYVLDAIDRVLTGDMDLDLLCNYSDQQILEALQRVHGVGKKVANCVALYAYGRVACVPIDVWILRAIQNECGGISPFSAFDENAGIIQQYVFYYQKHHQPN